MRRDPVLWQKVATNTALLDQASAIDPTDVAAVAALRKHASADEAAVALELCTARKKAADKFGERAATLMADTAGVEQASSKWVAWYKAGEISTRLGVHQDAVDLCCGIGGDSIEMCGFLPGVTSVDRDPLRAWMTKENTNGKAEVVCDDVSEFDVAGRVIHIDPARRQESSGRRAWRIDDYQPGPEVIGRLVERSRAASVKLSPGIDIESIPWEGCLDFISENGRLVQAVLWTGDLMDYPRRATAIGSVTGVAPTMSASMLMGEAAPPRTGPIQRFLYTVDPAAERAELMDELCWRVDAHAIHPKLGILTREERIAGEKWTSERQWLTGFELIEQMPWRIKRVKQWLAAHDGGLVEVKTRGKACDPDIEQKRLRSGGGTMYTVFVLRFDKKVQALITRRLEHDH